MYITKVKKLKETYGKKAIEEDYSNDVTNNILWACNRVLEYNDLAYTTVDKLTFGEYTRRLERWMKELETLIEE